MKRAVVILIVVCGGCAAAQQSLNPQTFTGVRTDARRLTDSSGYAIVHSFSSAGGIEPASSLLYYKGSFYGTAMKHGGDNGMRTYGTIFSVDLTGHERVLHRFKNQATGYWPATGLTEAGGMLYGTTYYGASGFCQGLGCGTIFSIAPTGADFKTLYTFTGRRDGGEPNSTLTLLDGTLYGTTQAWSDGGCATTGDCGTVFAYDIASAKFKTLHAFKYKPDVNWPLGQLVTVDGKLYGTAQYGGLGESNNIGYGGIFSVTPAGKETVVYRCVGNGDCSVPAGGLTRIHDKLYGTSAYDDGYYGNGVVFAVGPGGKEQTLYTFPGGNGGMNPRAALTPANGVLYGTTRNGGTYGAGTAFSVTPAGAFQILHNFGGASDGGNPVAAMIYRSGELYGTLPDGGDKNKGLVFSLTP